LAIYVLRARSPLTSRAWIAETLMGFELFPGAGMFGRLYFIYVETTRAVTRIETEDRPSLVD